MIQTTTHKCFRIYADGSRSETFDLSDEEVVKWREYNEKFRFGCAQMVDGKCVFAGYLNEHHVREAEAWSARVLAGENLWKLVFTRHA